MLKATSPAKLYAGSFARLALTYRATFTSAEEMRPFMTAPMVDGVGLLVPIRLVAIRHNRRNGSPCIVACSTFGSAIRGARTPSPARAACTNRGVHAEPQDHEHSLLPALPALRPQPRRLRQPSLDNEQPHRMLQDVSPSRQRV